MQKPLSQKHILELSQLLYEVLTHIRLFARLGENQRVHDLADAFHNLPAGIWRDDFDLERFQQQFITPYENKYGLGTLTPGLQFSYSPVLNRIISERKKE